MIEVGDTVRVRPEIAGDYMGVGTVTDIDGDVIYVYGTWDEHEGAETFPFKEARVELLTPAAERTCTAPGGCPSCPQPEHCQGLRRVAGFEPYETVDEKSDPWEGTLGFSEPCGGMVRGDVVINQLTGEHVQVVGGKPNELLPTGSQERKDLPVASGVIDYFPAALAEIAKVSKAGNDKHNPGEPLHWARGKSMDQADALMRHFLERGGVDSETGLRHSAEMAWRALALLQLELEEAGTPMARGAR